MKIISWNVNGLRAVVKKGFKDFFDRIDADIFCIQETKMQIDQLDKETKSIFDEYDLRGKKIQFCFAIFLNQNSDFFVFVLCDENFGNSLFCLMNLLKNFYEDKNNNNK